MKDKILSLKKEGKSIREIGKIVGLSKTAVWCRLNPKRYAAAQKRKRIDFRKEIISLFGGKCKQCGYDKCLQALDFHHVDPSQKSFSISNGYRLSKSKEAILEEAKKCVLLCSNCHHEAHEKLAA